MWQILFYSFQSQLISTKVLNMFSLYFHQTYFPLINDKDNFDQIILENHLFVVIKKVLHEKLRYHRENQIPLYFLDILDQEHFQFDYVISPLSF